MPNYAYVEASLACPGCGQYRTDLAAFQWGYLAGYAPRPDTLYRVGDPIRWRVCNGSVPRWAAIEGGVDDNACNVGDPAIADLYARDELQSWLADDCAQCGASSDGASVEIRQGVIVRASIVPRGFFQTAAPSGLLKVEACGALTAIPDEPLVQLTGCGPPSFWTEADRARP